ncbi:FAD-dependent oxidoreductase [Paracoccus sphaerophysae]|uniref:FAD-dependent oxidoreductase n=1 Tax=Paracoccus sphaerophysae TaxID=690417 RepID=UPI001E3E3CE5|nr:FAD-dependent oxidoreductase [Paracoccus sphaerophysae]
MNLARRLRIECDMQRNRALYLAGDDMGARGLRTEAEARHAAGIACDHLRPAEPRDRFGIDRTAALVSDASASANPAQLAAGLLGAAAAPGVARRFPGVGGGGPLSLLPLDPAGLVDRRRRGQGQAPTATPTRRCWRRRPRRSRPSCAI